MTKIISFVNHKGGVGKTTTTLNLGQALAKFHKQRVLLIDLDPQANLSSSLGFDTDNGSNTIYGTFKRPIYCVLQLSDILL